MSMFQLDTAFVLEMASVAAGLLTLHRAAGEPPAGLRRVAGYLLIAAGALTAVCTVYYGIRYSLQHEFDHLAPAVSRDREMGCPMMQHGGMQDGMMKHDMMQGGMMMGSAPAPAAPSGAPASTPDSAAHDQHHPGGQP